MAGNEFKGPIDPAYAGLSEIAKTQWDQIDKTASMMRDLNQERRKDTFHEDYSKIYNQIRAEHSGHVFNHNPPGASNAKTPKLIKEAADRKIGEKYMQEDKIISDFVEFSRSQILAQDRGRGGPQPESKRVADQFAFYRGQANEAPEKGQAAETKPTPALYSPDQSVDTSHIDQSGPESLGHDRPGQGGSDDGHGL